MTIKKYFIQLQAAIQQDDDDKDDDDFEDEKEEEREEIMDGPEEDVMEHLASTIRNMISNLKIGEFYVNWEKYDISVQFVLNKKERFGNMMRIMGVLKKLQTDILIQYDAEVDLWETKEGDPLLTVNFYYSTKVQGMYNEDDIPF